MAMRNTMRKPLLVPRSAWLLLMLVIGLIGTVIAASDVATAETCSDTSDAAAAAASAAPPPAADALHVQDEFLGAELRDSLIQVPKQKAW